MAKAIQNNIRRLRFDHQEMTQQELADRIGVTRQTVNAIELGKYSPSLESPSESRRCSVFRSIRSFSIANVVIVGLALSAGLTARPRQREADHRRVDADRRASAAAARALPEEAVRHRHARLPARRPQLKGRFDKHTLTFSGETAGDNFTMHVDSTAVLKSDGTFEGTLKAHFVEFNDEHQVRRERDQDMDGRRTGIHGATFPSIGNAVDRAARGF